MQKDKLIRGICETYCCYYKPGKDEDMACMGLIVIRKLLQPGNSVPDSGGREHLSTEAEERLFRTLCVSCPFASADCDYAGWKRGGSGNIQDRIFVPCGGFIFIGLCIDHGTLDYGVLDRLI